MTTDFFFFQKFSDIQAVAMVGKNEQKKKKKLISIFFFPTPGHIAVLVFGRPCPLVAVFRAKNVH